MKSHRNNPNRTRTSISTHRWTAYAAAAAATGFTMAETVDATIPYSGLLDERIPARGSVSFSLGSDSAYFVAAHFNYVGGSSNFSAGGEAYMYFHGAQSAAINGMEGCYEDDDVCASLLHRRDLISTRPFVPGGGFLAYDFYFNFWNSFGNFRFHGSGLVGFKFNNGAGDQYGWVRVRMMGPRRNYFKVVEYAYGDPADLVRAGQTTDDRTSSTIQSLGGLALGAKGLVPWRLQRGE